MNKLTKPSDIIGLKYQFTEEIIEKIEREFHRPDLTIWDEYCYLIMITGKYSKAELDEVAFRYLQNGWRKVKFKTIKENKKYPLRTEFLFYYL